MTTSQQQIGIFTTDASLRVSSWDGWLERVTGQPASQVYRQPLEQLVPDLDARGLRRRFQRVLDEGVIEVLAPAFHRYLFFCEPQFPSRHFTAMQQYLTIAPLREDDRIVGTLVTVEDVTARLERERDLAEQLDSPDEATRLRAARELEREEHSAHLLAGAIGDTSWRVRQSAVEGLARYGGADAVVALIQSLRAEHRNPSVLNSALQVLALTNVDVVVPLVACLRESEADVRIYAALALGERHDARAVAALIDALGDPDTNVRYQAIESLGKLRAVEAVDALLLLAESRDFFLAFPAIDALTRIGDPRAAVRLAPLLGDQLLKAPAAEALGQLGDESAVAPLVELLNSPGAPAPAIVQALAALHECYEQAYGEGRHIADLLRQRIEPAGAHNLLDALDHAQSGELRALVLVLGWLDGPAVQRALARMLGQPAVRKSVMEALVRHGSRVTELLIEQLATADLETRQAAIVALGRIGDPGAVPALIHALNDDLELATSAAGALGAIGDRRAFDALLGLVGHPDPLVRQAAVGALNSLGHPDLAERTRALLDDPDPYVRESAVKIAGYFGFANCVDAVLARTGDPDERVRRAAIEHLPYLDDPRVLPALTAALGHATAGVRAVAARALGQVDGEQVLPALLGALDDPDAWVRYFAARSIGQQPSPVAVDAVARLARSDPASHVRIAALEALGRIGGAPVVALLAPYTSAGDPDIARAALAALGLNPHPDAFGSLEVALRAPDPARRSAAVQALAKRGGADSIAALRSVAAGADLQMAQVAVDALAQLRDAAAIAALVDLAADPAQRDMCVDALARLGDEHVGWVARGLAHTDPRARSAVVEALAHMKRPRASEYVQIALGDSSPSVRATAARVLGQLGSHDAERQLVALAHADPDLSVRRAARAALQR